MRVLLLAAWAVVSTGALMVPCHADPDSAGAAKVTTKERLNSLSPGEAARAARSRARASASTGAAPVAHHEARGEPEKKVTSREKKSPRLARTVVTERRHVASFKSYRHGTSDRRRYVGSPRDPRVGDVVPDNVTLYPAPRRYASQPPYPDPYEQRQRPPLNFFFFHPDQDADGY